MIVICVYVPESALQQVARAMFKAGAGKIGQYAQCAFYSLGTGQFMPLEGSNPHTGAENQLEVVAEWRLEVVTAEDKFDAVMQAMFDAHPYEEPAWNAFKSLETSAKAKSKL